MLQRWFDAQDFGVRFGLDQARESVAGVAADALARPAVLLVELHPQRHVKRLQALG